MQAESGAIEGRVDLALEGASPADIWPLVVYLERPDGSTGPVEREPAVLRQDHARFDPRFMVVTAGRRVRMPNNDVIYHNAFSFSRPNDFDVGIYPRGESRTVTLDQPGFVEVYCSIHENMNAGILVVPTPWHTIVAPDGSFALREVPEGPYQLKIWAWSLPPLARPVEVRSGGIAGVEVRIGTAPAAPAEAP